MKKRRKIKVKNLTKLIVVIILIIISIVGIKTLIYKNSTAYKLKELGYNNEQITKIKKLDKKYQNKILSIDYDLFLLDLFNDKYFNFDNFDRYIDLHSKNKDISSSYIVGAVNVGADKEAYSETKETDIDKNMLMLVNKYNYLPKSYKPKDVVNIKNWYAYGSTSAREKVYEQFIDMFNDAKEDGLMLIVNSGYRDYELQEDLYEDYKYDYGDDVDKVAARPGYSEHQTGLCLDISNETAIMDEFEDTNEFRWMQKNAYKYGFILRYPKGKEIITGYDYESWHYRYVGVEVATKIKELDITFDEYYEYYIK